MGTIVEISIVDLIGCPTTRLENENTICDNGSKNKRNKHYQHTK